MANNNGSIPVAQKNKIVDEFKACVIREGKDPDDCLQKTVKAHGLTKKQTQELIEDLRSEEDS